MEYFDEWKKTWYKEKFSGERIVPSKGVEPITATF